MLEAKSQPHFILPPPPLMMATVDGTNCYDGAVCFLVNLDPHMTLLVTKVV